MALDRRASRLQIGTRAVLCAALVHVGALGLAWPARAADLPIPELERWQAQMVSAGATICSRLASTGSLGDVYYDMTRVMYQIADYTGDSSWAQCAGVARALYRDGYVLLIDGHVAGYWNFPTGLTLDFQRTGDGLSQEAVTLLSENAAYAADVTPLAWTEMADRSREVAYAILSYIDSETLGQPRRARRAELVDQAYGHMDQWFVQFTWQGPDRTLGQFSPFMVALTAHSLIRDWEQTGDPRLIPTLRMAADWLWANAWLPAERSMFYDAVNNGTGPGSGAPDLNLLIAPMYAFLYRQTGDPKYRDEGDALFAGGVDLAYLGDGKHFDQNYWWSFDYVRWRSVPNPALSVTIASPAPGATVSGITTVSVSVTGNSPVTTLRYYLDGVFVGEASPSAPSLSGDSSLIANGPHTLTVTAVDEAGNIEEAAVAFTVLN
jgi:Bacterial Ig domain